MRLALPPILTACVSAAIAALVPVAAAAAAPKLPPGADRPPVLPPGVVPAEAPAPMGQGQAPSAAGRLLPPGAPGARAAKTLPTNPWATVNICDTENRPNSLGVRAGMPGTGRRQLMFMRFTAQYWSRSRNAWLDVPGNGRSRWVYAGSARYATQQTGWTFAFEQPPPGTTFVMRAVVEQEWRTQRPRSGQSRSQRAGARKRASARKRAGLRKRTGERKRAAARKQAGARKRTGLRKRSGQRKRADARKRAGLRKRTDVHKRNAARQARELWTRAAASRRRVGRHPRARWAVSKQRTVLTKTGLAGVDGGDPPGTSKAMCLIW